MRAFQPQDATTNPSLILAATKKPEYAALLDAAIAQAKDQSGSIDDKVESALDHLLVRAYLDHEGGVGVDGVHPGLGEARHLARERRDADDQQDQSRQQSRLDVAMHEFTPVTRLEIVCAQSR